MALEVASALAYLHSRSQVIMHQVGACPVPAAEHAAYNLRGWCLHLRQAVTSWLMQALTRLLKPFDIRLQTARAIADAQWSSA